MVRVQITAEQRMELNCLLSEAQQDLPAYRLQAVLLSADGSTANEIASAVGLHPINVRKWLHRYKRYGVHGLIRRPSPGRPPAFDNQTRNLICQIAQLDPRKQGLPFFSWSLIRLKRHLVENNFVKNISIESLRQILNGDVVLNNEWNMSNDDATRLDRDTGKPAHLRCPKCGDALLTDGYVVWCSNIGQHLINGCTYGLLNDVRLVDAKPQAIDSEDSESQQELVRR